MVYVGTSDDQNMLLIYSPVGEVELIDGNLILALTENLPVSVKSFSGYYMTHHAAPLADLSTEELLEPMDRLMMGADALEEALGLGDRH